jgi:hypothetical protein
MSSQPGRWYHRPGCDDTQEHAIAVATKPTRQQQQACDQLAETLVLLTDAVRLDGRSRFGAADLAIVAERLATISSAFSLDEIVARALERRGRALGLRSGTSDLLMLMEGDVKPLHTLLLPDESLRELVAKLEEELGEV